MALSAQHEALQGQIRAAADALRKGGVIAIPTDTLYGLAASVFNGPAVRHIYRLKGRPDDSPLPVLIDSIERVSQCAVGVSDTAWRLMEKFWPGALTIVLRRTPKMSTVVSGGQDSVALRIPDHPVPRAIVGELDAPITGTSANRTGGHGLTTAQAVKFEFGSEIDLVVEGQAVAGFPSTVIDLTETNPSVLRVGALCTSDIEEFLQVSLASHD